MPETDISAFASRIFLLSLHNSISLSTKPTSMHAHCSFSCKYYLNLVLVDEEDRRYFKQQEITLWRKADKYKSKLERSEQVSNFN